jgi:hypothetical protein
MIKIDMKEHSTKRGLIWIATFIIGLPMVWLGKDVTGLILLAGGVAGGLGLLPDKKAEV